MRRPLNYEFDVARRCVHVRYDAQPVFEEWEETMERIFSDPAYVPGFGMLLDRRYVMHPADPEYMRRLVAFVENNNTRSSGARWALLVTDTGSFDMAKMAEQLAPSERIRAFRELEKAREWIAMESVP
ncbi:MAG: hypothetical protein P4L99_29900 [Chthoniobacter sp.]|nr:hypothetical protein [Chthoniobacter sp.]